MAQQALISPPIPIDTETEQIFGSKHDKLPHNQFEIDMRKKIIERKTTQSKFDTRKNSIKSESRKNYKDFLKRKFISAIGAESSVSSIIRQNYKNVMEMNIPREMRENGYKRRDLYQVYTHFLSIYRLQQSMRKDF